MESLIQGFLGNDMPEVETSSKRKVVFIRLPKTASTSIIQCFIGQENIELVIGGHNESLELCDDILKMTLFQKLCDNSSSVISDNTIDTSMLSSISDAMRIGIGSSVFDDAFKFCIVRNPYDRVVSAWKYIYGENGGPTFGDFCTLLMERGLYSTEWNWHQRVHICEQLPHILNSSDDDQLVSGLYVGRFENLEESVRTIKEKLGLQLDSNVPHINSQRREAYQEYYTSESMKVAIYTIYKRDIDYFGYEF